MEEGLFLHVLLDKFVGCFSFLPCFLNLIELLLESWKEGSSKEWVGPGFISHVREKGYFLVTEWMVALWINLAMGRSSNHFWGWPSQKMWRYVSSS